MQDDEVGVLPGAIAPLSARRKMRAGFSALSARDVLPAEALYLADLRRQQRQHQPVARGAVHRLEEAGPGRLERRGPGRVIGGDDLERAVHEAAHSAARCSALRSGGLMTKSPARSPR